MQVNTQAAPDPSEENEANGWLYSDTLWPDHKKTRSFPVRWLEEQFLKNS